MMGPASRQPTTLANLLVLLVAIAPAGPTRTAEAADPVVPTAPADRTTRLLPVIEAREIGGIDARSAALLLSGQQSGDVTGALAWTLGPRQESGLREMPFVIEVDGASLIAGLSGTQIAIGLFTYAIDDEGHIANQSTHGVMLEREMFAAEIAERGIRVFGRTVLAPGSYTLRVMIQARGSDRFFIAQSALVVPSPGEVASDILTSLFPDPGGSWVTIRQPGAGTWFGIGGEDVVPAARPVLLEDRETAFFVGGAGLGATSIGAALTDQAGRVLAEVPVEISAPRDPAAPLRPVVLPVIDLPPGHYTLVLEIPGDGQGTAARQSVTVALTGGGGPYSWLERTPRSAETTSLATDDGDRTESRFRRRKARAAYLEAMRALADGDAAVARQHLMALERMANSDGELRSLRRVEDSVSGQLAAADPKSLLPIALLHQQLVRRYAARNEFVLASYARAVAADRAVQIAGESGGSEFAASLLVNLASDLARTSSAAIAVTYLEEALEAAPTSQAALLALGVVSERSADYDQAAAIFERLVESHPHVAEGRLRLAVNLARSGRQRAAENQFRALLQLQPTTWVDAVGAQEYASMLIGQNRLEEALSVLDSATKRLPDDQRLWVLSAFAADAEGRSLGAVEAILQMPPAGAGVSPRARYTEWPELGGAASAHSLRVAAQSALPDLAAALQAVSTPR